MPTHILGISMSNHDRAACLLRDGHVVAAIAEERIDRRKRSEGFYGTNARGIVIPPLASITYVLRAGGIGLDDVDLAVCGRSITSCRVALLGYLPLPADRVIEPPIPGHHLAHAYSAYATAPFDTSAVLVVDEQGHHRSDGTFERCSWYEGTGGALRLVRQFRGGGDEISIGMFYNVFAGLCGLSEAGRPAAGKLMGLAPHGRPRPEWASLVECDDTTGDVLISLRRLDDFFSIAGVPLRPEVEALTVNGPDDLLTRYRRVHWSEPLAADLARKAQDELETAVVHAARTLRSHSAEDRLAYAGGVALNCTANRRLRQEAGWSDVFVHPAATDDGAAVGLAFYGWMEVLGRPRRAGGSFSTLLGRGYGSREVEAAAAEYGLVAHCRAVDASAEGAQRLAAGEIICWFDGRSEWGPRALGARSIVANPLIDGIAGRLNATVKFREPFRPFGISGTATALAQLVTGVSPSSLDGYMLTVGESADARLRQVQHVDGTVRYQVVARDSQPTWYAVIEEFERLTGLGAVLNTSFNLLGEPLVESPGDAMRQFLISGADALIAEGWLLVAAEIPPELLARARQLAWGAMPGPPLHYAISVEAAGYPEAAAEILRTCEYTQERARAHGPAALRSYYGLCLRIALGRGDTPAAMHNAEQVLRLAALPADAAQAAERLAGLAAANDPRGNAARLLRMVAGPGGVWRLGMTVLDPAIDDPRTARARA